MSEGSVGPTAVPGDPIQAVLVSPSWPPESANNGIVTYVGALAPALPAAGVNVRVVAAAHDPAEEAALVRDEVIPMPATRRLGERLQSRLERMMFRGHGSAGALPGTQSPSRAEVRATARRWRDAMTILHRQQPIEVYEIEESYGYGLEMNRPAADWAGLSDRLIEASDGMVRRLGYEQMESEWRYSQAIWRDMTGAAPGRQVVRLHNPWFLNGEALGVDLEAPGHALRVRREGLCIAGADAVSAPSSFVLEAIRERYGMELPRARVIPNPIAAVPADARWTRAAATPMRLLFVGRFDRMKGGDTVIEAFARVHARHPEASLVFVGPDEGLLRNGARVELEAFLAETLSPAARARVEVKGPLPTQEIEALRRESELTIVASRVEVFGMVVLEAMAMGSPLLCADAGAPPQVYGSDDPWMLFPAGDAEALAARIVAAFAEPARVQAAADAALVRSAAFRPSVVAEQTAALYRALVR